MIQQKGFLLHRATGPCSASDGRPRSPDQLQFEIGDLDIPDRASQNEIAFAAVDLSAEVLATRGVTPVEDRDHRTAAQRAKNGYLIWRGDWDRRWVFHQPGFGPTNS